MKILFLGNATWPFDGNPDLRGIHIQFRIYAIWPVCQLDCMRAFDFCLNRDGRIPICIHSFAGSCCSNLLYVWSDGHCVGIQCVVSMEHHIVGHPQEGGDVLLKCVRCNKLVRSSNGGCRWAIPTVDKNMGDSVGKDRSITHGLGPCHRHVGVGIFQGHVGKHSVSKFEVEFLDRLQEMEMQVRLVRSENVEFKRVLSHLYTLALATHFEVKAQNSYVAEKIEHLEETKGLCYPHKAQKTKAASSKLADLGRKMDKLKQFMAHAGNFVDLSSEKNGVADSEGVVMNIGLQ